MAAKVSLTPASRGISNKTFKPQFGLTKEVPQRNRSEAPRITPKEFNPKKQMPAAV